MITSEDRDAIVCDAEAIPREERAAHEALARRLFEGRIGESAIVGPDGEGFQVEFGFGVFDDLVRWLPNERRCCAFLRFTVDLLPAGGSIRLTMTGPAGTRAFVAAQMLGGAPEELT